MKINSCVDWFTLVSPGKRFFSSLKPASDDAFPSCRKPAVQTALINYTLLKINPYLSLRYSVSVLPSLPFFKIYPISFFFYHFSNLSFLSVALCCCCCSSSSSSSSFSSSFVPLSLVLYPYFWRSRNENCKSAPT